MQSYLDFEKAVADLEGQIQEMRTMQKDNSSVDVADEIARLEIKADQALKNLYGKLTPTQKTLVARHPNRPHYKDFVARLIEDYMPLSGDRAFADDPAIQGGLGRFRGTNIVVIGHEKGWDTASRVKHNFGMAKPEGYRKAIRLMELADRFKLPVLSLVDTAGAYPGIGAEERGQAEAIARSTETCLRLGVPMVSLIIGEGGSGGAIAIASANQVLMMEHAIYSVISPEGAASILWRDAAKAQDAATALKITAQDLKQLGVIDEIVPEPLGGAQRDSVQAIENAGDALEKALAPMLEKTGDELRTQRYAKFMAIGRNLSV